MKITHLIVQFNLMAESEGSTLYRVPLTTGNLTLINLKLTITLTVSDLRQNGGCHVSTVHHEGFG